METTLTQPRESIARQPILNYGQVKDAAMILRAVNHKLRQQIIKLLDEKKRVMVTDIYVKLRLEQSIASQHLAILRKAKVVNTEREGKVIYYSVDYDRIDRMDSLIKKLVYE